VSELIAITERLRDRVDALTFGDAPSAVYNPLRYAWSAHRQYLERFGSGTGRTVLVGMNPGPFGMAQTGVPFGEVASVRDWMGIRAEVSSPPNPHPKRPVLGFACTRSEVSGRRLWGWAAQRFGTPEAFFERFFVVNYCPLVFMEGPSGRNLVPEKLPAAVRAPLFEACDEALRASFEALQPTRIVGVGVFAERQAKALSQGQWPVGRVLHPSPASPAANRGWVEAAERQFREMGVHLEDA